MHLAPSRRPVGILGFGMMGRAIARAVLALGFPVFAASRMQPHEQEPGITVLSGEDAIQRVAEHSTTLINVLPLTDATRGILNKSLFARMPRGAVLIQLGRGDHLVEPDLDEALDSGQLSAASLDVFGTEPLPPGHPWWTHPKILVTPHLASDTSPEFVAGQVVQSLGEVLSGQVPFNAVSRASGY
jgi:glyoxylate/hydroxypyruvate reductase A